MPKGTDSPKLPMSTGRMMPSDSISQMAAANAHATWVPMPSARARRYMRSHHNSTELVRNRPASSHQPPFCRFGMCRPLAGDGGSSASQGSWRTNCTGFQWTEANMLSPMISNAMKPQISESKPVVPR